MRCRGGILIKPQLIAVSALVGLAAAGCGPSNGSNSPNPPHIANVNNNVLQLAVGTANVYGTTTGLNVVVTYRQGSGEQTPGDSGAAVDTPTLTVAGGVGGAAAGTAGTNGDTTSTIGTGPAAGETTALTATAQTGANVTSFGISGQASGLGLEPYNYNQLGSPDSVAPYAVPVYDALAGGAGDPNQIPAAWGGPPAFDILGNGTSPVGNPDVPGGTAGISEGLDVFEDLAPVAGGAYSLSVSLPANSGTFTKAVGVTLPAALTVLPAFTSPVPVADASGEGATFAITFPAGVTEAYVEVLDIGPGPFGAMATASASCNGSSAAAPVYYTIELAASGTATLGDAAGPGATPSICTPADNTTANGGTATPGDTILVSGIGFDYPAYESSYPKSSGVPNPTILGTNGEDDITISASGTYVDAASTMRRVANPNIKWKHPLMMLHRR